MTEHPLSTRRATRLRPWALVLGGIAAVSVAVLVALGVNGAGDEAIATTEGVASAAGVEVAGADVHLGRVPLNTAVEPTWTLVNTGSTPVVLGQPHADVLEGCCPGPLTVDATELAPGASTMLRFPLQMHAGMDGAHDFDVHVPVATTTGEQAVLTVGVDGFFGG